MNGYNNAKLTAEQVVRIRETVANEEVTCLDLADVYGVSYATILNIVHGRTWKKAGGPVSAPLSRAESMRKAVRSRKTVLSSAIVQEARERYAEGELTITALAQEYEVPMETLAAALRGDTWKEVGGPVMAERGRRLPAKKQEEILRRNQEIIAAYCAGESRREIAERFGLAIVTVGKVLNDAGTWKVTRRVI